MGYNNRNIYVLKAELKINNDKKTNKELSNISLGGFSSFHEPYIALYFPNSYLGKVKFSERTRTCIYTDIVKHVDGGQIGPQPTQGRVRFRKMALESATLKTECILEAIRLDIAYSMSYIFGKLWHLAIIWAIRKAGVNKKPFAW